MNGMGRRDTYRHIYIWTDIDFSRDIDTRFNVPLILVKANQVISFW